MHGGRRRCTCILERFGDRDVYARMEGVLGDGLTLHEVIAGEMATITLPLERGVAWVREHVTVREGFRELAARHRPVIVSSGFRELIEPVLEREGVELEVLANAARRAPGRLGAGLARRDGLRDVRRGRASAASWRATPMSTSATATPTAARRSPRDRVFARDGLAQWLDAQGVRYEPFRDLRDVLGALD